MTPERRRLGRNLVIVAIAATLFAMLASPMGALGLPHFGKTQIRFYISYVLAIAAIAAALAGWVALAPHSRRASARGWAIGMSIMTMVLIDLYLLSWYWRY